MTSPFKENVEILGLSTKDNQDGTSTVSLLYRETAGGGTRKQPHKSNFPWSVPRTTGPDAPPQPTGKRRIPHPTATPPNRNTPFPWTKVFAVAIAGTLLYAIIMSIIRLN